MQAIFHPSDKISADQVLEHLKKLQEVSGRVKNPLDDIEKIFTKIEAWTKTFGEQEQQEKEVAWALQLQRQEEDRKIQMHNVKTVTELMETLQEEIKLTDDEMIVIIFSSLHLETLNNLII